MRKELLLCTVIFSQNIPYLDDFFKSICIQDKSLYDFLIINEDVNISQYSHWLKEATILQSAGSPLVNRIQMFRYAIEKGYKYILWQDSDDICLPERIPTVISEIGDYDILVHDMRLINTKGEVIYDSFIGSEFCNRSISFNDIKFKNFIGFGNTIIRLDCINPNIRIPNLIKAVDWWLACYLTLQGKNIKYINTKLSDYRQYNSNLASLKITSTDQLRRQLDIIKSHYTCLINLISIDNDLKNELIQHIKKIEIGINKLSSKVEPQLLELLNKEFNQKYVWWEEINYIVRESNCLWQN